MRAECGCPGHFIAAERCRWRRHTQLERHRISSVGDYFPILSAERDKVGFNRLFETVVFPTTRAEADPKEGHGCGCREVTDWAGMDLLGANDVKTAQRNHEKMVEHYLKIEEKEKA